MMGKLFTVFTALIQAIMVTMMFILVGMIIGKYIGDLFIVAIFISSYIFFHLELV